MEERRRAEAEPFQYHLRIVVSVQALSAFRSEAISPSGEVAFFRRTQVFREAAGRKLASDGRAGGSNGERQREGCRAAGVLVVQLREARCQFQC